MFASRPSSVVATALLLGACAGMSEQACLATDWRTAGFEDGAAGRPASAIGGYRQACSRHGVTPDLDRYRTGHAEGVESYCRPARGFEVGSRGGRYQGVCPTGLEVDFLAAYNAGRHLYELESAVRRIDNQLAANQRAKSRIREELIGIAATMAGSETDADERVRLVARSAELGQRYAEIDADSAALEHDRAARVLELEDYRQALAHGY